MPAAFTEKAFAKVNLTLRVVGRRADGYHELESLVAFADLADTLTLTPGGAASVAVSGPFAGALSGPGDNLVLKAVAMLGERVAGLRAGAFALVKNIPVAGGIGGGSADAAAALRLLSRANAIAVDDARLAAAALKVGADVPVCLDARPRIMRGVGEKLSPPIAMPALPALLVNPGVALATRDVFSAFAAAPQASEPLGEVPRAADALLECLARHGNDLTLAAIACAPVVAEVLAALRDLPGARLSRMSGSGATCFALMSSAVAAAEAARHIKAAHPDWWVHAGHIGAPP